MKDLLRDTNDSPGFLCGGFSISQFGTIPWACVQFQNFPEVVRGNQPILTFKGEGGTGDRVGKHYHTRFVASRSIHAIWFQVILGLHAVNKTRWKRWFQAVIFSSPDPLEITNCHFKRVTYITIPNWVTIAELPGWSVFRFKSPRHPIESQHCIPAANSKSKSWTHEKKNARILSIESWLFTRDPYDVF